MHACINARTHTYTHTHTHKHTHTHAHTHDALTHNNIIMLDIGVIIYLRYVINLMPLSTSQSIDGFCVHH